MTWVARWRRRRRDRRDTLRALRELAAAQTGELATIRTLHEIQTEALRRIERAVCGGSETLGAGHPAGDSGHGGDHGGG